ncbi:response regulator transcription factor [Streptomyces mobaraensis NBRC 13819 = DSM 40847]|uniref:LuxR family two component transcriptional regulator n=1 Tax=Streptomyces mobaraensis (strain ATCC 29032 / DSM 40847 / JCM 4168 / NBRC 13819 / NCIMB 11159 / IPCR 16-22) TaxID=1223523 RepID=M3BKP2_STRM1|nr:response regulator transcription factor [Streptomyces mobaraensis]EMF00170.1 LuxR family two component transcriptional regulator [Streptomyces mobaraensis NBRC 13819 = DSM 40847]QTT72483.1 response regulator transcription factor [Streptomyces mobaraensis NBRC 13819 = DSM 40847]
MRILIAEDNVLLREGVSLLLTGAGHEVCAAVEDGEALLPALLTHRPDVAVLDVRLPPGFRDEGLRAAVAARERIPGLPVLVLSQYVEQAYASRLLAAGAGGVGYLLKDRIGRVDDFLDALERVAAGQAAMDPEVISQLMVRSTRADPLAALSPREREVLALMAEGHGNSAIGERLFIAETSVNKHIGNIFTKLGLPTTDGGHRRVRAVLTWLQAEARG